MKKKELETQETTMHQMLVNFIRCARLGNLTLGEVENAVRKQFMIDALQEFKGHQQKSAKALGMHRNTFGRAVDKFDINVRGMQMQFRAERKKAVASAAVAGTKINRTA